MEVDLAEKERQQLKESSPLKVEKNTKFGKASRFKQPQVDERELLYPSIDFARQTYHASKTSIKPRIAGKAGQQDRAETFTVASTAATSAVGDKNAGSSPMKPGVVIAKISALSDEQLERLLRVQFRKNVGHLS